MREMTLRELQLFALEILKDVHRFCTENRINYSLYGGTLLGAVRHEGFIPWDDDIDIIMPRDDYERFNASYRSDRYELFNRSTDDSFQLAYTRVCDTKITQYKAVEPCSDRTTGVWIDVFPADGCPPKVSDIPDFYNKNVFLFKKTEIVRFSMAPIQSEWVRVFNTIGMFKATRHCVRLLVQRLLGQKNRWINLLIETNKKYSFQTSCYWASFSCPYQHVVYHPKDDFSNCSLMKFEDSEFYVMKGWDGYLNRVYGNYMELPPKEKQVPPLSPWYKFYWL